MFFVIVKCFYKFLWGISRWVELLTCCCRGNGENRWWMVINSLEFLMFCFGFMCYGMVLILESFLFRMKYWFVFMALFYVCKFNFNVFLVLGLMYHLCSFWRSMEMSFLCFQNILLKWVIACISSLFAGRVMKIILKNIYKSKKRINIVLFFIKYLLPLNVKKCSLEE